MSTQTGQGMTDQQKEQALRKMRMCVTNVMLDIERKNHPLNEIFGAGNDEKAVAAAADAMFPTHVLHITMRVHMTNKQLREATADTVVPDVPTRYIAKVRTEIELVCVEGCSTPPHVAARDKNTPYRWTNHEVSMGTPKVPVLVFSGNFPGRDEHMIDQVEKFGELFRRIGVIKDKDGPDEPMMFEVKHGLAYLRDPATWPRQRDHYIQVMRIGGQPSF